jgi:sugar phosphate isomerase/epimerase
MSCKALISPSLLALYSKLRRGECLTHIGTEGLLQLQKDLADPRLKVNFDPSHIQVHGDDPVRAVRELGSAIVHVYIKDAAGSPGKFVFPPLGMGCVDFEGIFRALVDIGYGGFIYIEY